ncbi:hypothetical protein B0H13DRAFT_2116180 [Mycena leptocephala]|nr:hypothetical protein B0H13DRAFT_2116180 [Mycena leptocephala]
MLVHRSVSEEPQNASHYILPPVVPEKERLAKQYAMKKILYGWTSVVPDGIDVAGVEKVIDIAAGTCVWTLDFAKMPQVRAHRTAIEIYACDINPGFFPSSDILESAGIRAFTQDLTKPFPAELYGTFDLIHVGLLCMCLTEDGWGEALANFKRLLKPNGIILLEDADPILFSKEQDLHLGQNDPDNDLNRYMAGSTWMHKANCLYTGFALRNAFIVGLTYRLPRMLEKAGFVLQRREYVYPAMGKLCHVRTGMNDVSLADYDAITVDNIMFILEHIAHSMLKTGTLEIPPGNAISIHEIQPILNEIGAGVRDEGSIMRVAHFVARRE